MVATLSHIAEFRSGAGGLHIMRVNALTEILLRHLVARTDQYGLTPADMSAIAMASSLHDVGTVTLPEGLLKKQEHLTDEEFETYKSHALAGAELLESLPYASDTKLQKFGYQICRWHHERWDGSGYPDGLVGDDTPIAAQIVGVADTYDSLTNDRRHPDAYSHEMAMDLLTGGVKGPFNPLLIECLVLAENEVADAMKTKSLGEGRKSVESAQHVLDETLRNTTTPAPCTPTACSKTSAPSAASSSRCSAASPSSTTPRQRPSCSPSRAPARWASPPSWWTP